MLTHALQHFFAVLNNKEQIKNLDEINDLFKNQSPVPIMPILSSDNVNISKYLNNQIA